MADTGLEAAARAGESLRQKGLRLALAESCTGGYIAHLLTEHPGASEYLDASVVAYSARAKTGILGISHETLMTRGAISPACAIEMVLGARRATGAEAGLSITGNLGPEPLAESLPGAIAEKPVGLVYVAVAMGQRAESREFRLDGTRAEIKEKAALMALTFLLEALREWT